MKNYFNEQEFVCKCCGEGSIDGALLNRLNLARQIAGIPFVIKSGYRCEKNNKKVGGRSNSAHLRGLAVDIQAKDSRTRHKVLSAVYAAGFKRIGINPQFIHVDVDESLPSEVSFMY